MAHIFASHSQRDESITDFFLKAFAGTKVKPTLQELEKEPPGGISAGEIERNIQTSNAVFVFLSENVESLRSTRDWVNWECGVAANKDIWVFEPFESLGKISVVVPRLTHYVRYVKNDDWREYFRSVIDSYDDSNILLALSASAATGAALNDKDRSEGALTGLAMGVAGLVLHGLSKPSFGMPVRCGKCQANYRVHIPNGRGIFRCPVCNGTPTI